MKSPAYLLATLLPLVSQVALANPVAGAEDLDLEERGGDRWGHHNHHPDNDCKVKKTYWYHKYPCDSSHKVGESKVGDTFAPVCKYQDWYKNPKGWWVKEEFKPRHCYVKVDKCD